MSQEARSTRNIDPVLPCSVLGKSTAIGRYNSSVKLGIIKRLRLSLTVNVDMRIALRYISLLRVGISGGCRGRQSDAGEESAEDDVLGIHSGRWERGR